jgi:hypothetical protein
MTSLLGRLGFDGARCFDGDMAWIDGERERLGMHMTLIGRIYGLWRSNDFHPRPKRLS